MRNTQKAGCTDALADHTFLCIAHVAVVYRVGLRQFLNASQFATTPSTSPVSADFSQSRHAAVQETITRIVVTFGSECARVVHSGKLIESSRRWMRTARSGWHYAQQPQQNRLEIPQLKSELKYGQSLPAPELHQHQQRCDLALVVCRHTRHALGRKLTKPQPVYLGRHKMWH